MLEVILAFGVMAGIAAALALLARPRAALLGWLTISAIVCSLAGLALSSQPMGESTSLGRVGGLLVRWGFEVGQGQLFPAVAISWFIWALLGAAAISLITFRSDRPLATMILVWAIDAFALIYVLGIALSAATSLAMSLLAILAALAGMLIVSGFLWFHPHVFGGRRTAMLVAAGPPLLVGGGYGFFLLIMLVVGQFTRWN